MNSNRRSVLTLGRVFLLVAVLLIGNTLPGAASGPQALPSGGTLSLDGVDDYASAPDNATLDLGTGAAEDFTIEAFFYVPDLTNTTTDTLVWKQGSYGLYILYFTGSQDRFIFRVNVGPLVNDYVYIFYETDLTVGWHHVAAVYDNEFTASDDLLALYLDGSQAKTGGGFDVTPGIWNSSSAVNIGGYAGINSLDGSMDEVRLSNTVRYSGSYTVPASPFGDDASTRALWHFDEANGATSFADSSGNGNTLTGQNGAHVSQQATTFADVPAGYWAFDFIERLYNAGITGGCGVNPLTYCPEGIVTRGQMAVFLLRGIHGSAYTPPPVGSDTGFGDVPTSYWSAGFIKQLAAEGITAGCGNGNYCPEAAVNRAQMAVFLLRSKYGSAYAPPPVGAGTGFGDVPPSHWAAPFIKQLVAEGITAGCGSGNYCPDGAVTRAQMAVFLVKTFSLP